jgi:hypothetical protein
VPAFTASGIDPDHLLKLPFQVRHAVAAEPSVVRAHALFEEYSGNPTVVTDQEHRGLRDARHRMETWFAQEADARTPEQRKIDDDALYAKYYDSTGKSMGEYAPLGSKADLARRKAAEDR